MMTVGDILPYLDLDRVFPLLSVASRVGIKKKLPLFTLGSVYSISASGAEHLTS